MATISPGRLNNVTESADAITTLQDNFEILTQDIYQRLATEQDGTPTTLIGPPTTGAHILAEFWRDAVGGEHVCTSAGTPGTWKQITPAPVTADPSSGTYPTGYLILNVTTGTLKRHAGSYVWQLQIGDATDTIGFWGATPVVQPSGASQAAVTLGNADGEIDGVTITTPATITPQNTDGEIEAVAIGNPATITPQNTDGEIDAVTIGAPATITPQNTDNEIAGLTFSATPTQAECEALRDKCEDLAEDVIALDTAVQTCATKTTVEDLRAKCEDLAEDVISLDTALQTAATKSTVEDLRAKCEDLAEDVIALDGKTQEAATKTSVESLRGKCEELADDVRNLSVLVHALRTALVNAGVIKGSAA